jgi:hypothetical protein
MLGELYCDQKTWVSEIDREEAQEPGVLVNIDSQTSASFASSSPTSIDSSESFQALVNTQCYSPAYSSYSSLKLPRKRSQRTKKHFSILPPTMHLPQSIGDALHLNGGSSSPSYDNADTQTKDAISQHKEAKAQPNGAESLTNGDAETQTNCQVKEEVPKTIKTIRDHTKDQEIGEPESLPNGTAQVQINGDTKPQTGSQTSGTAEIHTNGDVKSQNNSDANAKTNDAAEELKNPANIKLERDAGPQCNGHAEPPVNRILEAVNGDEKPQSNGLFESQTNGNSAVQIIGEAKPLRNGEALSTVERNGGSHVQSNGRLTPQTNGTLLQHKSKNGANGSNGISSTHGTASLPNSVQIPIFDTILDSITAGWILLISRYQRDTFHNFTWGVKDALDSIQTVATEGMSLGEVITVTDLLKVVRRVRAREIEAEGGEMRVFFNDGTKDEVCTIDLLESELSLIESTDRTCSGHSKPPS